MTAPLSGTVRRVPRPRATIPPSLEAELIAAADEWRASRKAVETASERLKAAMIAARDAGGSHRVIAEAAGVHKRLVQDYVPPRPAD